MARISGTRAPGQANRKRCPPPSWLARRRRLFRQPFYANSVYLLLNSATGAALGAVYWMAAARLYDSEDVGLGAALVSAAVLLAFVSSLGLGLGLIRFLPSAGADAPGIINNSLTIASMAAVVCGTVFLIGLPLWSPTLDFVYDQPLFALAFVMFVLALTLSSLVDCVFVALRRAEFSLAQGLLLAVLRLGALVAMASAFNAFGIFASWGLAATVGAGLGLALFLPLLHPGYRPQPGLRMGLGRDMMAFSFANYASVGLWSAPTWILPIMVVNMLGGDENAHFYITWSLAGLLFAIPAAASTSLFAEASHREDVLAQNLRRSIKFTAVLLVPALAVLVAAARHLLLLFGEDYANEGTSLVWLLAPSAIPVSVNVLYLSVARIHKRLRDVIVVAGLVAAGTLILSYAFMRPLGTDGAGVGWLVSQSVVAAVVLPALLRAGWPDRFARSPARAVAEADRPSSRLGLDLGAVARPAELLDASPGRGSGD